MFLRSHVLAGKHSNAEKKTAEAFAPAVLMIQTHPSGRFGHIRCLRPLGTLDNFEFDRISFLQRTVTLADDRRIMYEDIGPVVPPDESVSL